MQTSIKLQRPVASKPGFGTRFKKTLKEMYEHRASYIMITPFMLIFLTFTVFPVILSIILSFTYYNVLEFPRWTGWHNYVKLFVDDELFSIALQNTFKFAIIIGPVSYLMCLFFAWVVNELPGKMKAVMTLVFYAPSLSGGAALAIWQIIFSGDMYGYLNSFLIQYGFISTPIQWVKNTNYMFTVVVIVQLWASLGTSFLTLRAGFNTLDRQYFEAAAVDGIRNRWQELWYITLPMMSPHLWLSAVLAITGSFTVGGVASTLCGTPSTGYAVWTIMHHLNDYSSVRYERGYACAIATILFLFSFGANQLAQKLLRRVGK